jgi:hypothetical protein
MMEIIMELRALSNAFPALEEVEDEKHDGDEEQEMDERAGDAERASESPQNQQEGGGDEHDAESWREGFRPCRM